MINETLALLRLSEAGDTPARLADRATSHGVFARTTARRARNIVVEMFAPRYLASGDQPAGRLKMPTLLVRGRESDILSDAGVREFLAHLPNAEYVDVGGAGHMIAGDRNDAFTDAVRRFLARAVPIA